jgi:hypothetical protein
MWAIQISVIVLMETAVNEQCCLWECRTTFIRSPIGTIVTFWKGGLCASWAWAYMWSTVCGWVGVCACMRACMCAHTRARVCVCVYVSSWNSVFSSQEPNQLQHDCSLSPMLLSSSILPPYLFHGALISARNKLAHLVNCCYVISFYCIVRDYQTAWRLVPE